MNVNPCTGDVIAIKKVHNRAATKAPNIGTSAPIPTIRPIKNAYGIFMIKDPAVTKLAKIKHSKQVPPT